MDLPMLGNLPITGEFPLHKNTIGWGWQGKNKKEDRDGCAWGTMVYLKMLIPYEKYSDCVEEVVGTVGILGAVNEWIFVLDFLLFLQDKFAIYLMNTTNCVIS